MFPQRGIALIFCIAGHDEDTVTTKFVPSYYNIPAAKSRGHYKVFGDTAE